MSSKIKWIFLCCTLLVLVACDQISPNKELVFNGTWEFQKEHDSLWYPAEVPGVVHTDLLKNNLIEDPYYGNNEQNLQWIEHENWVYTSDFIISKEELKFDHLDMEFEGLDTYAKIYINDKLLLETDNMFRNWKLALKEHVVLGKNTIKIIFESPLAHNKSLVENYPQTLPSGNETVGLKVSNFTRKAAYHFGWDWGPRFVTSGIWRPIKMSFWNEVMIENTFIKTEEIRDSKAKLSTEITLESTSNEIVNLALHIKRNDVIIKTINQKEELVPGLNTIPFELEIENPELWWPNGAGAQPLYELDVLLSKNDVLIEEASTTFGIKTIELIQEEDYIGTSYYFKVNGEPIFMKGANYIPQDLFLTRVTDKKYEDLFEKIVGANMNMIRVWGGGIYENDIFYDLCDEKGILVWQDFMFAGSMYPNTPGFIATIKEEVSYNIKRLRNHPSIALWCGNNEIEVAWGNWGWQNSFDYSKQDSTAVYNTYKTIFKEVIPNEVDKLSGGIPYVSTSPTSNWGTPENFNHGSMHYWGVWHGREPFENYKTNVGRFMVEYGFQSFPEMSTIEKFSTSESWSLNTEVMQNRQKSYIGNGMISKHVNNWFDAPTDFDSFVEKSQSAQQIGMQLAIQSHRLGAPHCMGTLFWQLNDCWPGPSWSVIDYYGNEKEAYKSIAENFKDVIAILDRNTGVVTVLNDGTSDFVGKVKLVDGMHENEFIVHVLADSKFEVKMNVTQQKSPITLQLIEDSVVIFEDKVYLKK